MEDLDSGEVLARAEGQEARGVEVRVPVHLPHPSTGYEPVLQEQQVTSPWMTGYHWICQGQARRGYEPGLAISQSLATAPQHTHRGACRYVYQCT